MSFQTADNKSHERLARAADMLQSLAWPVGSFAVLLLGWQFLVPAFKIPE